MLLGVIADDFTGASDIANTLSKGVDGQGMRTRLYLGTPSTPAEEGAEAAVIALKSRSIAAEEAIAASLEAMRWLRGQGAKQIIFKYCSTFDSTAEGNIGPVAEALAKELGVKGVVACPAFPTTGRTVYQGHLFVHDKLLNESGLENHPLNPMTDADIRRWLDLQTDHPVGHLALKTLYQGKREARKALEEASVRGEVLVIADAVDDEDLLILGEVLADAPLITGGSGIALGLPANFRKQGLIREQNGSDTLMTGSAAILAGSCSGATREQVEIHSTAHPALAIDVEQVMNGELGVGDLVEFIQQNQPGEPLVYSSGTPESVKSIQEKFGRETVAAKLDNLFATTATRLVELGYKRLVIAGGETSGAVVTALDPGELAVGSEIDPGVPALYSQDYAIVLKSGNFGSPDFFSKALGQLAADSR